MCDVLVLEDEDLVRMVVVAMLEDNGLQVREAATPEEAIDVAEQPSGCSVLVTDIDLGVRGVNGFGVAAALRRSKPTLPVVYMSGRPWVLEEHPLTGNERALSKPFALADLLGAVQALRQTMTSTSHA